MKNEQIEGTDFLHVDTDPQKLIADQNIWVAMVKKGCDQSVHGTLKNEQME